MIKITQNIENEYIENARQTNFVWVSPAKHHIIFETSLRIFYLVKTLIFFTLSHHVNRQFWSFEAEIILPQRFLGLKLDKILKMEYQTNKFYLDICSKKIIYFKHLEFYTKLAIYSFSFCPILYPEMHLKFWVRNQLPPISGLKTRQNIEKSKPDIHVSQAKNHPIFKLSRICTKKTSVFCPILFPDMNLKFWIRYNLAAKIYGNWKTSQASLILVPQANINLFLKLLCEFSNK